MRYVLYKFVILEISNVIFSDFKVEMQIFSLSVGYPINVWKLWDELKHLIEEQTAQKDESSYFFKCDANYSAGPTILSPDVTTFCNFTKWLVHEVFPKRNARMPVIIRPSGIVTIYAKHVKQSNFSPNAFCFSKMYRLLCRH